MQKIVPHIWFSNEAEEAATFYASVFDNAGIDRKTYYTEVGKDIHGMSAGTVMTARFHVENFSFVALNGGPVFKPNPSISFFVQCDTKEKVSTLWAALSAQGKVYMPLDAYPFNEWYGWVEDRFGVSWQLMLSADTASEQRIVPSLMFTGESAGKAEEALAFYVDTFKNAKAGFIARYGSGQEPDKEGTVTYGGLTLEDQDFACMDSARMHDFSFSEGISLMISCTDQEEIDYYWSKLSADPSAEQCGWLKDKYGVSWQIVPTDLEELLGDGKGEKSQRVMAAMLAMHKIDIETLRNA